MAHQFFLRHGDAQHLAFDGTRGGKPTAAEGERSCPAQAPAQFTTMPAANCVLLVRTPDALPLRHFDGQHLIAGRKIDAAMSRSGDGG